MLNKLKIKIGILAHDQEKLLLIRERPLPGKKYFWNIIKSTFEANKDRDFLATARREAREEAGIKVKFESLVDLFILRRSSRVVFQLNFAGRVIGKSYKLASLREQRSRNEDIIEIKLFSRAELKKLKAKDFINRRSYLAVQDWLKGKSYDLSIIKTLDERKK